MPWAGSCVSWFSSSAASSVTIFCRGVHAALAPADVLGHAMRGKFELPGTAVGELETQAGGFAIDAHGKGTVT